MSGISCILPSSSPFAAFERTFESVKLAGFCSANGGSDAPCETKAIAIDRLSVTCAVVVANGDKVIFSFEEFGLLEATVTSTCQTGFEASFEPAAGSKFSLYLDWLKDAHSIEGDAQAPSRIVPVKKVVTLGLEGEPESMARIIDLSRSDVSVTTTNKDLVPEQPIMVGSHSGHVVELFDGGATVEFDHKIAEAEFDPLIELRSTDAHCAISASASAGSRRPS